MIWWCPAEVLAANLFSMYLAQFSISLVWWGKTKAIARAACHQAVDQSDADETFLATSTGPRRISAFPMQAFRSSSTLIWWIAVMYRTTT